MMAALVSAAVVMAGVAAAVVALAVMVMVADSVGVIVQLAVKKSCYGFIAGTGNPCIPLDTGHSECVLSAHAYTAANKNICSEAVENPRKSAVATSAGGYQF